MKSISLILKILSFILFTFGTTIHAKSDPDLVYQSKYWPNKVAVNVEIVGVTYGKVVKPGREWIFLRFEEDKCLVDMGHNGIHAFDVEDTDILDRMIKISEERPPEYQGLFTSRYTKTFYDPKTYRGFQLGEMDAYNFFVLFYFDYERGSETTKVLGDFIEKYLKVLNDELKLQILLLPLNYDVTNENLLQNYIDDRLIAPTQAEFLLKGTVHSLNHDHKTKGDVVLVDNFGKVIKQFFLSDLNDKKLFKTIKNAVEEESSKAKQVKTESVRKSRNPKK